MKVAIKYFQIFYFASFFHCSKFSVNILWIFAEANFVAPGTKGWFRYSIFICVISRDVFFSTVFAIIFCKNIVKTQVHQTVNSISTIVTRLGRKSFVDWYFLQKICLENFVKQLQLKILSKDKSVKLKMNQFQMFVTQSNKRLHCF